MNYYLYGIKLALTRARRWSNND